MRSLTARVKKLEELKELRNRSKVILITVTTKRNESIKAYKSSVFGQDKKCYYRKEDESYDEFVVRIEDEAPLGIHMLFASYE